MWLILYCDLSETGSSGMFIVVQCSLITTLERCTQRMVICDLKSNIFDINTSEKYEIKIKKFSENNNIHLHSPWHHNCILLYCVITPCIIYHNYNRTNRSSIAETIVMLTFVKLVTS